MIHNIQIQLKKYMFFILYIFLEFYWPKSHIIQKGNVIVFGGFGVILQEKCIINSYIAFCFILVCYISFRKKSP